MRCPKCGYISFDYVKSCAKCGKGLVDTFEALGPFIMENSELNWFLAPEIDNSAGEVHAQVFEPEVDASPVDLGDIDMSDLVSDEASVMDQQNFDEITVLDADLLDTTVDENFQKALEDVIAD